MSANAMARATDPSTSHAAAQNICYFAGNHKARILAAIKAVQSGPWPGATAAEIAAEARLSVVQVDRRLPELQREGRAVVLEHRGKDLVRDGYRVWSTN